MTRKKCLDLIHEEKCTHTFMVPTQFNLMLENGH